jgi:hypothetical protein
MWPALIEQYLGGYAPKKLAIARQDLLALGRQNPNGASEHFNMAYLAIYIESTPNVRQERRRFGDSPHSARGLQIHLLETIRPRAVH